MAWQVVVGVVSGLVVTWLLLLGLLLLARPKGVRLADALRLLPDTLALLRGLLGDAALPRGERVKLGLLFAYLAMPFDLVPDFLPVIGYADDAILVFFVLRSLVRRAGLETVRRHWRGSEAGFAALARLAGLTG